MRSIGTIRPAGGDSGRLKNEVVIGIGLIKRSSRHLLRVSHLHRCHRIDTANGLAPIFMFTVVQGHSIPCQWAHAYALLPGCEMPISRHFRFDIEELESYRQLHDDQSLRWLDTEFMFQLSLDQIQRQIAPSVSSTSSAYSNPEAVDESQLLRHYINGDLVLSDALLEMCGEHYLLHRQLQTIKAFPVLHTDKDTIPQQMPFDRVAP
jgi:hypothetical protein